MLKKNTVKIYSQDPMGKYLPVEEKNLPMFKTAEELIKQGYEEMRELVGMTLASEGSKRLDLNLPI